jgi:hypothetical protein
MTEGGKWPNPTDWVGRLYRELEQRQQIYDEETDELLKRNKSGAMLGQVIKSLRELPCFRNDAALYPLKDLLIFLSDLDRGRDHAWSRPINYGGTSITTTAKGELKLWVRAAFVVLTDNEFKPVEAYRRIAIGLTDNGRTGRGGKPVRWQTVQAWVLEDKNENDQNVEKKLRRWWTVYFEDHSSHRPEGNLGQRVCDKELAGRFSDLCWCFTHLRD